MGRVLERKDHTSIYIPKSPNIHKKHELSVRFVEMIVAMGLILVGAWIILTV
jgi:flagellar biogenesis protein FliO